MNQQQIARTASPEVEVVVKPQRRRFTLEYKRRIVNEADKCRRPGEIGALLRREGLYSSHLSSWRASRDRGEQVGGRGLKKRGPVKQPVHPDTKRLKLLERENRRLRARAERAEALVELPKKSGGAVRGRREAERRSAMMQLVADHAEHLGVAASCDALGVSRSDYYRSRKPASPARRERAAPRKLTPDERQAVLDVLHSPRFVDVAPAEVHATLLDEGRYLCSVRTMYRLLAENHEIRERRDQLRHPSYSASELLATRPNELWSWDITKLLGPAKWTYYYLYVILDVFSRYVVGWTVAYRELASIAERLIKETCGRQGIEPGQLTIHADRGSSMTSKSVAFLMANLGVTKTHSRPYISNDNPYSESQFKTLKYRPDFPGRFGGCEHARSHCQVFFHWYNPEHRHSGLGMLTPHDVHYGLAGTRLEERAAVLAQTYSEHPERFPRGMPRPADLLREVWINKPASDSEGIEIPQGVVVENLKEVAQ